MKGKLMLLVVALVLSTVASGSASAQPKLVLAEVVSIDGTVELKRGKDDYRPAKKGEPLQNGDLLRAKRGTKVVIRCASNSANWTVPDDGYPWGVANVCSPTTRSLTKENTSAFLRRR